MEARDIGLESVLRREGGDVISGGSGGWVALEVGEVAGCGEVGGEEAEDIVVVILVNLSFV